MFDRCVLLSQEYYFPTSHIVLGQGGIYCALEDVWVEVASGYFVCELIPNRDSPAIQVVLSGTRAGGGGSSGGPADGAEMTMEDEAAEMVSSPFSAKGPAPVPTGAPAPGPNGISVKIKLEGLKLAGDSGTGVPKLGFDSISVTLVLQVMKFAYSIVGCQIS